MKKTWLKHAETQKQQFQDKKMGLKQKDKSWDEKDQAKKKRKRSRRKDRVETNGQGWDKRDQAETKLLEMSWVMFKIHCSSALQAPSWTYMNQVASWVIFQTYPLSTPQDHTFKRRT